MNNCGKRFQTEVAKFRFLNELIKVLSPKVREASSDVSTSETRIDPSVGLSEQYFGAWTPQAVKDRVTEVLYGWTLWLKDQPKIKEAYSMLKKQGVFEL